MDTRILSRSLRPAEPDSNVTGGERTLYMGKASATSTIGRPPGFAFEMSLGQGTLKAAEVVR
jgi:hypothetical protein